MPRNKHPQQKPPRNRWKQIETVAKTVAPIVLALHQLVDLVVALRDLF
jgi:hypothetical protein